MSTIITALTTATGKTEKQVTAAFDTLKVNPATFEWDQLKDVASKLGFALTAWTTQYNKTLHSCPGRTRLNITTKHFKRFPRVWNPILEEGRLLFPLKQGGFGAATKDAQFLPEKSVVISAMWEVKPVQKAKAKIAA